jgi:hypothetical protein
MVVVAKEDGTNVTINPTAAIAAGGGLLGTAANVPRTYALAAGQYLQFTQTAELTGSAIQSDRPVAVIGGSTLMDVPTTTLRADSAEQMLPPIHALASEYVAVRYRSRSKTGEESVPWRVVGVADGTELTYEPTAPAGAPAILRARQVVEFSAPGPFIIKSQDAEHPFYFAAYMTGGGPFSGEGDPEFVNVIAPAQYLPRYTFFTDPTYPETNLVAVRVRDASGAMPNVTLDCAGTLGGWQPLGFAGIYEWTRINLSTGNFVGQNGCDNGVHTITATLAAGGGTPKIGVTVWGWGNPITWPPDNNPPVDEADPRQTRWVSYAYPAGANVAPLNSVILPAR